MDGLSGVIDFLADKGAPKLVSLLLSPFSGRAMEILENVLGVKAGNIQELPVNDSTMAKLKLAEKEAEIALDEYRISVTDAQDARRRELAIHDGVPFFLACCFVVIYTFVQVTALFFPDGSADLISARVQDIMIMIIGYFFGSMHRRKDTA